MSGDGIFRNFHQEATGTERLNAAAIELQRVAEEYDQQAEDILRLAAKMETAWQGDAADGAQRGAAPLAVAHMLAVPLIRTSQDLAVRQVGSFGDAKNDVRPVPPAPAQPDPWSMLSPGAMTTFAGQVAAHRDAAQHNVDVMRGYENASLFNTNGQPVSYGTLTPDDGVIELESAGTGTAPPTGRTPGTTRPDVRRPPVAGEHPAPTDVRPPTGSEHPAPTDVPPVQPAPGEPAHRTETSHFTPRPPTAQSAVAQPGPPSPHWTNPAIAPGGAPGVGTGNPRATESPATSARADDVRRTGERAGEGRTGFAAGAGERTVARGTSAKDGPATGPFGSGKGRSGEDREHRRASFLRQDDPESVFGSDEKTTPPVIE